MPMHGFAAEYLFAIVDTDIASCCLELRDNEATRQHFPYAFRLRIQFRLDPDGLTIETTITNPGPRPLPASFGLHPGFAWPLVPGTDKLDYVLRFPDDECLVYTRPVDRLLGPSRTILPLVGGELRLNRGPVQRRRIALPRTEEPEAELRPERWAERHAGIPGLSPVAPLDETGRCVPLHRAVPRSCGFNRFRRRLFRQTRSHDDRTGAGGEIDAPDCDRSRLEPGPRKLQISLKRSGFRVRDQPSGAGWRRGRRS